MVPFVKKLMGDPRVNLKRFKGMGVEEAVKEWAALGERMNKGNPWKGSEEPEHALRKNLGYWKALGAGGTELAWLAYGFPARFVREPEHLIFRNHPTCDEHEEFVSETVRKNVAKGLFVEVDRSFVKVCNPMLVDTRAGKPRLCNDERFINSLLPNVEFQMARLGRDIPSMVQVGDELATEDFSEAYYSCMMDEEALPYTCFAWGGKFYTSKCILFGFSLAPFYFTKLNRPIVVFLGTIGVPSLNYIDDWAWSAQPSVMEKNLPLTKGVLIILGWKLNEKKKQRGNVVQLLGFDVWAKERVFRVPDKRVKKIVERLREAERACARGTPFKRDDLKVLAGHVLSTMLAIPDVRVWTRSIYAQSEGGGKECILSGATGEEVKVLLFLMTELNGSPFFGGDHEVDLFVDTGEIGWGATVGEYEAAGRLEDYVLGKSSTLRELTGLLSCLGDPGIVERVTGKRIRVTMDSMASVRNLLKGGGPVRSLCELVKDIWLVTSQLGIQIFPRWMAREKKEMVRVDGLSKRDTKWLLTEQFKAFVRNKWGVEPECVDFAKILPLARSLAYEKGKRALVVPTWKGMTWWEPLMGLAEETCDLGSPQGVVDMNASPMGNTWQLTLALFNKDAGGF
jgi:hypothetical protein